MADINASLIPLAGPIASIFNTLKVIVGGVFGLYVILIIFRIKEYFFVRKTLTAVKKEVEELSRKVDALSAKKKTRKRKKK